MTNHTPNEAQITFTEGLGFIWNGSSYATHIVDPSESVGRDGWIIVDGKISGRIADQIRVMPEANATRGCTPATTGAWVVQTSSTVMGKRRTTTRTYGTANAAWKAAAGRLARAAQFGRVAKNVHS